MKVLLLRNAKTVVDGSAWPTADCPLSEEGRHQARVLANYLMQVYSKDVKRIISSDYERALQTINEFATLMREPVMKMPEFRSIDVGNMWGLPEAEAKRMIGSPWEEMMAYPDPDKRYFLGGGETVREEASRAMKGLTALVRQGSDSQTAVISTHASCIQGIVCMICGMPLKNLWTWRLATASVTVINHGNGRWMIETVGYVPR